MWTKTIKGKIAIASHSLKYNYFHSIPHVNSNKPTEPAGIR